MQADEKVALADALIADFLDVDIDGLNKAISLLLEATQQHPGTFAHSNCLVEASAALTFKFYVTRDSKTHQKSNLLVSTIPRSFLENICYGRMVCVSKLEAISFSKGKEEDLRLGLQLYSESSELVHRFHFVEAP